MKMKASHHYIQRYRCNTTSGVTLEFIRDFHNNVVTLSFSTIGYPREKALVIQTLEEAELLTRCKCDDCGEQTIIPTIAGIEWIDKTIDLELEKADRK